tara:strand:+ start:65 stop:277 length:213 start_codon:yes stop_codon:yes gene_type:complete
VKRFWSQQSKKRQAATDRQSPARMIKADWPEEAENLRVSLMPVTVMARGANSISNGGLGAFVLYMGSLYR